VLETFEFTVKIKMQHGKQLGIRAKSSVCGKHLRVTGVDAEGLIADWNDASDSHRVRVNDRVIKANGVGGTVASIREELHSAQELEIVIQRSQAQSDEHAHVGAEQRRPKVIDADQFRELAPRSRSPWGLQPHRRTPPDSPLDTAVDRATWQTRLLYTNIEAKIDALESLTTRLLHSDIEPAGVRNGAG